MTSTTDPRPGRAICAVDITPNHASAGASFTVAASVTCADARDLRGFACHLERADGSIACRFDLAMYDGNSTKAHAIEIAGPSAVGEHVYTMVFPQQAKGGVVYEEARAEATVSVDPHPTHVTVWGLPTSATTGEPFGVVVGAKGGGATATAGKPFVVRDAAGDVVAEGVLGSEPWHGTAALFAAEATITAPDTADVHRWTAHVPSFDDPLPHVSGERAFTVTTVEPPSHEVTVKVRDHATQAPIEGLQVVIRPFQARTDADGVARVKVAPGDHRVFVSGYNYVTFRTSLSVADDVGLEAELVREDEEDPGDLYV